MTLQQLEALEETKLLYENKDIKLKISQLSQNRRQFMLGATAAIFAPSIHALAQNTNISPDGFFELTAKKTTASLLGIDKLQTPVWGYNGTNPGPLIRVKQGETVKVRLINELDQATTIHWHGIRIDNKMDGVTGLTQAAVEPGESFDYEFIAPDAGTYWYHTHNRTWEQLARGLYGMLIVEEPDAPDYKEINLILDDWRLAQDGTIDEESLGELLDWAHDGRIGNILTANGQSKPEFEVKAGERLRLRIVNVANSLIMNLNIPNHDPWVIALDGHPIEPRKLQKEDLVLAPAQRIDLVIDANLQPGEVSPIEFVTRDKKITLATLKYNNEIIKQNTTTAPAALPISMPHNAFNLAAAKTVELNITGGAMGTMRQAMLGGKMLNWQELVKAKRVWAFNGIAGDMDKPLIRVKQGETVRIDMINDTAFPHAMHLHGTHFTVVGRNNKPIEQRVWRDTELIYPDEKLSFAFLADNLGKWIFHCHMIEHQAGGMMTWIEVV